jgi:hypothetical protein
MKLYKPGTCMAMQKKARMTSFLFKEFIYLKGQFKMGCQSPIQTC